MKTIHLALFGPGKVGTRLLEQVSEAKDHLGKHASIKIKWVLIANSSKALFSSKGINKDWQDEFQSNAIEYTSEDVVKFFSSNNFENLVSIDCTASSEFPKHYITLVKAGSHLIAANKVANTLSFEFYEKLRRELKRNQKNFYYETNVGAGLPVLETIRNLHLSGEKVTKIRGVFSGSLSYIFNTFSSEDIQFSQVLKNAEVYGYTEPDARMDLSGKDVARKLLILARELQLKKELEEVKVQSLIPSKLNGKTSLKNFNLRIGELDGPFHQHKQNRPPNQVLRYIGELDLANGSLETKLINEPANSALGQIKGADNIFEIYTESYKEQPIVIQGAGAGAEVTARGVFGDLLRISERLN